MKGVLGWGPNLYTKLYFVHTTCNLLHDFLDNLINNAVRISAFLVMIDFHCKYYSTLYFDIYYYNIGISRNCSVCVHFPLETVSDPTIS